LGTPRIVKAVSLQPRACVEHKTCPQDHERARTYTSAHLDIPASAFHLTSGELKRGRATHNYDGLQMTKTRYCRLERLLSSYIQEDEAREECDGDSTRFTTRESEEPERHGLNHSLTSNSYLDDSCNRFTDDPAPPGRRPCMRGNSCSGLISGCREKHATIMLSQFCTVSQLGAACLARLRSNASVDMTASVVDSIAVVQFHFRGHVGS
jgi:hypothetical protein